MTKKLEPTTQVNAGAELEKELAEKLGFRVNINAESDEAWISEPGGKYVQDANDGGTVEYVIKLWVALLEYAAEAALYRTQWKDTETLLRAVERQRDEAGKHISRAALEVAELIEGRYQKYHCGCMKHDPNRVYFMSGYIQQALTAAELRASTEAERAAANLEAFREASDDSMEAESRVAALQAQLETAQQIAKTLKHGKDCKFGAGCNCGKVEISRALSQLPTPAQAASMPVEK
jgi:hypothetical protein